MKKLISFAVAGMFALSLAACGSSSSAAASITESSAESTAASTADSAAADSDLAYLQNKGKMTIGYTVYEPMNYTDESGTFTGFDTELATAVCEKLGVEPDFVEINWDTKETELAAKSIDCIWNGFTMNGREDDYTWSDPYVDNSQVMVVSENSGINSLSDLAGKTVGVQAASAALDLLQSEEEGGQKELADTFAALQQFPDYNNAFVELQAGSIDAVAMDIGVAKYQLESRGEGYKILDEHLNSEKYAIGFKKGNTELCDKVNEGLQQVLADGTFDKLAEKYGIADMVCLEKKGE